MQIQILLAFETDLRERLSLGQPASATLESSRAALYTQSLKLILSTLLQPEEYTPRLSAFRWTLLAGSDQSVFVSGSGSGSATRADSNVPWKPILNRIFLLLNQLCGASDAFEMVSKLT